MSNNHHRTVAQLVEPIVMIAFGIGVGLTIAVFAGIVTATTASFFGNMAGAAITITVTLYLARSKERRDFTNYKKALLVDLRVLEAGIVEILREIRTLGALPHGLGALAETLDDSRQPFLAANTLDYRLDPNLRSKLLTCRHFTMFMRRSMPRIKPTDIGEVESRIRFLANQVKECIQLLSSEVMS